MAARVLPDIVELRDIVIRATTTISSSATSTTQTPNASIAQYATELNGVNQNLNNVFKTSSWWSLGALAMLVLTIRMIQRFQAHVRHLMAMNKEANEQSYWAQDEPEWWWKFKKHILYAPLGRLKHNNNMKIGRLHMGCVASRFHFILITLYILANLGYCLAVNYWRPDEYSIIAELRGRTGTLAVINMIALVLLAGRNNPLIWILNVSFDTFNLLHRWMGRVVVIEALIHTLCWAYVKIAATGWSGAADELKVDPFAYTGLIGVVTMIFIAIQSLSPIRHAFYETFLDIHIILAIAAWWGLYLHCKIANLPQQPIVLMVGGLWLLERLTRFTRTVWNNWSFRGTTRAHVLALPGDACRVTLMLPTKVTIKPGSHAYLRFQGLNFLIESHPFSIAWTDHIPTYSSASSPLPISEKPERKDRDNMVTAVSFVIQNQLNGGMTQKLFNAAVVKKEQGLDILATMEGPYGGHHSLDSYGHVVLFAGNSGITHQMSYISHLISSCQNRSIATRKITLVWIVPTGENFEWVRPWMERVLKMDGRRECLKILLFVTRPKTRLEMRSPSKTVVVQSGRPKPEVILEQELKERVGAMCVTVCGPGGLTDSVRKAVRDVQGDGVVDFMEEGFSW